MANIRSKDYNGFNSASAGTSPAGWMFWSGSKALGNTPYSGVGVELVAGSESYLRFDATQAGAELDIKARKFFIGTTGSQYISGSSGNIEISSSLFHLDPVNNKLVIGAGTTINASLSADEIYVPAAAFSSDNAKAYISSSGAAGFDGDGHGSYNVDFTNGSATIGGLAISSSFIAAGNTIINSAGTIEIGSGGTLDFHSDAYAGGFSTSSLAGRWEIDPDDGQSLQLRLPSESFSRATDTIALYVSSSGQVGVNTKSPGEFFEIAGNISASGNIAANAIVADGSGLTNLPVQTVNDFTNALKTKLDALETDKNYVHTQSSSSTSWEVTHSLGKYPSPVVVDSAGTIVVGQVDYDSLNTMTISFKSTFSGKVYLN